MSLGPDLVAEEAEQRAELLLLLGDAGQLHPRMRPVESRQRLVLARPQALGERIVLVFGPCRPDFTRATVAEHFLDLGKSRKMVLMLVRSDHHVDLAVGYFLEVLHRVLDALAAAGLCLVHAAIDEDAEIVLAGAREAHQEAIADAQPIHADGRPPLAGRRGRHAASCLR